MAGKLEQYVQDYQARVHKKDAATLAGLASQYNRIAQGLLDQARDLKAQYDQAVADGQVPGPVLLDRLDGMAQLAAWLDQQAQALDKTIQSGMTDYTRELAEAYGAMFAGIVQDAADDTGRSFQRVMRAWQDDLLAHVEATLQGTMSASAVGLPRLARSLALRQMAQVRNITTAGIVQGLSYRDLRRQIHQATGAGLTDTYRWVRTEGNRALRTAGQAQGQKFGVTRWRRTAALSARTCIACIVADGTIYETDTRHDFHVNCRCALVPLLPDALPDGTPIDPSFNRGLETGQDWFKRQKPDVQAKILGPLYTPWRAGEIGLADMVQVHDHPTWGLDRRVASLAQAKAHAGLPAQPGNGTTAARVLAARDRLDQALQAAGVPERYVKDIRTYLYRKGWDGGFEQTAKYLGVQDPATLLAQKGPIQAAASVYRSERRAYVEPDQAIRAGKDYVRGLNVDPDTATPSALVRAVRQSGRQNPAPQPSFRSKGPDADQAMLNARYQWTNGMDDVPVRSALVRHGLQQEIPVGREPNRAYHSAGSIYVRDKETLDTVFHEVFHAVEHHNPEIAERYGRWLVDLSIRKNIQGLTKLADIYPGLGYDDYEQTIHVKGLDPYTTKAYASDWHRAETYDATEVATMWMTQVLGGRRWVPGADVWASDEEREWFFLVLGTLVGE